MPIKVMLISVASTCELSGAAGPVSGTAANGVAMSEGRMNTLLQMALAEHEWVANMNRGPIASE